MSHKFFSAPEPRRSRQTSSEDADSDEDSDAVSGAIDDVSPASTSKSTTRKRSDSVESVSRSENDEYEHSDKRLIPQIPAQTHVNHRDYLLHALLEERCTNEVLALHKDNPLMLRNSPEVQQQARARYSALCKSLSAFDVVPTGLEVDQHAGTRQMYRDALNAMGQQLPSNAMASAKRRLPGAFAALTLSNSDSSVELDPRSRNGSLRSQGPFLPMPKLLQYARDDSPMKKLSVAAKDADSSNNAIGAVRASRYVQEFEEHGILGRGGFGTVYHVRHRLDNNAYAVKRIPVSNNRLQRIKSRGQSEVDEVLSELRTLARLDHPNIVRYYNAWAEWVDTTTLPGARSSEEEDDTSVSISRSAATALSTSKLQDINASNDFSLRAPNANHDDGLDIVFEASDSASNPNGSYATSVEDEVGQSADVSSPETPVASSWANIVIHIQMSLHPMTLSDFLSPPEPTISEAGAAPPLAHCFHIQPSLAIFQAILDGVEYLHSEGIVHRDIKPSNIFLGRKPNPRSDMGAVDLMLCNECRSTGMAAPIMLEVRIGDFGLVAVADPEAPRVVDLEPVGTELYRPLSGYANSPSLDIHALGIVAFELLWKFDTRMERVQTLQQLKKGELPAGFIESFGTTTGVKIAECIQAMIGSGERDVSIAKIRSMLASV